MAEEKNPYPKGSYRYKLWERRQREKKAKEKPEAEKEMPETDDKTKRRKQLDEAIEKATAQRVERMRKGQFSDSNNESNYS